MSSLSRPFSAGAGRVGAVVRRGLGVALVLVGGAVLVQPALAATGFGKVASFGAGEFSEGPGGVAVNQSSGEVYVVDHGNQVVRRYDGSGNALGSWSVASPLQVALDGSKGASAGDVYVLSAVEGEPAVKKFDGEGKALGEVKETEAGSPFAGISGVAVDKEGDLWVQQSSGEVDRFDGTAGNKFLSAAFTAPEPPCTGGFAIDEAEHLYLPIGCASEQFSTSGADLGQLDPNFVAGVTTEVETNDVFANDGFQVSQYNDKREALATFGSGVLSGCGAGIGINHAAQHVYVADPCNSQVFVFAPVTLPSVTIDAPTGVTSTHADFHGTVNPEGEEQVNETTWRFEYSTDGGSSWNQTPGGTLPPGTAPVEVGDEVTLLPNQHVQVRLVATDAGGISTTTVELDDEFETTAIAPVITEESVQDITPNHVTLQGLFNGENSPTKYWFEYGTTNAYGTSVPATQDGEVSVFVPATPARAIQPVYRLAPGTTYHFRLVANSPVTTVHGKDQTFTTTSLPPSSTPREGIPGTGFLAYNRGWEKVSPNDKNGGDVMADDQRSRVAKDGNAANFASLTGFGDAIATGTATDYLSLRDANGWTTHAITPLQQPTSYDYVLEQVQPRYVGLFSDDLSRGVFFAASPVTADPNVANVANLYGRDNLRTPGAGSYELLSSCPLCASTGTPLPPLPATLVGSGAVPFAAGASADFQHVIFESQRTLTEDAPGGCVNLNDLDQCPGNLYESDHGAVRLVGRVPAAGRECTEPACVPAHDSQAGQGAGSFKQEALLTPHTISADGSRIFFTVPDFPGSQIGALYMRVNHVTTVQLNASERTSADPSGPQSARYWDATTDGARVFFSTSEALTDDAPVDGNRKLYMYDAALPASDPHNLTLISAGPTNDLQAVQGISNDGHYVYFAAAGQLVAAQPAVDRALYVWHDGTTRFIGSMAIEDVQENRGTVSWAFGNTTTRVTPDGLHLFFSSSAETGPTGYDQGKCNTIGAGGCREFYVYSYATNRVACASCNPTGSRATASAFVAVRQHVSAALSTSAISSPMSEDGRRVFFSTKEALLPQDINGSADVYEYDMPSGTVHLITTGLDHSDSYFMNASASGDDVFFLTRARLVGADADGSYDMYDARVGGGFPEPTSPSPPCSGEPCQGSLLPPPEVPNTGSGLVSGLGNVTALPPKPLTGPSHKRHCRRGYYVKRVKGRLRCVKRAKSHHATKGNTRHSTRSSK